jgi:hypothetical protein
MLAQWTSSANLAAPLARACFVGQPDSRAKRSLARASDEERHSMQIPPSVSVEVGSDANSLADCKMLVRHGTWLIEITWTDQHGLIARPIEGHRCATSALRNLGVSLFTGKRRGVVVGSVRERDLTWAGISRSSLYSITGLLRVGLSSTSRTPGGERLSWSRGRQGSWRASTFHGAQAETKSHPRRFASIEVGMRLVVAARPNSGCIRTTGAVGFPRYSSMVSLNTP